MAGFCRRCGDIIRGSDSRCKCGGSSVSSQVTKAVFETTDGRLKHDRWLKTYGERRSVSPASVLLSRSQSKPSPSSQLQNVCLSSSLANSPPAFSSSLSKPRESLGDRSLNMLPSKTVIPAIPSDPMLSKSSETMPPKEVKRGLSVKSSARAHVRAVTANIPESVDLTAAEEEVLTNVFGSVLDPNETRGRCGACQQIFKREGKIYPDPRREDESGKWAGVFYCRKCYVQRFSRGKCASCHHTIVGDEGTYIQLGKDGCNGLWHKKCFKCIHCQLDISNSPVVDLSGNPCCEDCFDKPRSRNSASKASLVTDIPDLRTQPSGFVRTKRTSIVDSPAAQIAKPAVDELRTKLRKVGIEKEPAQAPTVLGTRSNNSSIIPNSQPSISASASTTTSTPLASVKSLGASKLLPRVPTSEAGRFSTTSKPSFKSSPKLGSASDEHVLSPSANPLCPTCKQSLFRPLHGQSPDDPHERLGGTLATLPATGETFHIHCLTCHDCKQSFPNQKYVVIDDLKLCERCVTQRDLIKAQERLEKVKAELSKQRNETSFTALAEHRKSLNAKDSRLKETEYALPSFPSSSQSNLSHQSSFPSASKRANENPERLKKVSTSPFLGGQDSDAKLPMMSKSGSFTRFGGQSICPGCSKSGTIPETKPGPNNQRWHFKCLKCVKCHKLLDSGAKTFDDSNEIGCSDCLGKARAEKHAIRSPPLR